jgi:hypothetical protein
VGGGSGRSNGSVRFLDDDVLGAVLVLGSEVVLGVRVVVTVRVDGVGYAFGDLVGGFVCSVGDSVTKRMVLALVVVISHITLELLGGVGSGTSSFFYSDLRGVAGSDTRVILTVGGVGVLGSDSLACIAGALLGVGVAGEVGVTLLSDDGTGAFAELTFGNVDLGRRVVGGRAVGSVEVAVVGTVLNLSVDGGRGGGLVAEEEMEGQLG